MLFLQVLQVLEQQGKVLQEVHITVIPGLVVEVVALDKSAKVVIFLAMAVPD